MLEPVSEVATSVRRMKISGGTRWISHASSEFSSSSLIAAYIALLGLLKPAISLFL
jgi:hypothetical protein